MFKFHLLLFLCVSFVTCDFFDETISGCDGKIACAEQALIKAIDEYDTQPKMSFFQNTVVLEKTNEIQLTPRSKEGLLERVLRYFMNHELRFKFLSNENEARQLLDEARKRKLRRILIPILLLLKFKTYVLIPAALFALAFVAFNGLGAGMSALLISSAVAMKNLLTPPPPSSSTFTYEVVPQHISPHWSRTGDAGIEGLNALIPAIPGYSFAGKP